MRLRCHTRTIFPAVALVAATVGVVASPGHADDGKGPRHGIPAATEDQIVNDMRFRASSGLRADRPHVEHLFDAARAGAIEASTEVGGIVTPEEEALLRERTAAVDHVVAVAGKYFEAHPDDYAGMWIDQGLAIVGIGVTDNKQQHTAALDAAIGVTQVAWRIHEFAFSLDALYAVQRQIDRAASDLRAQMVDVVSTSIDEEEKVYVGVASDTTFARQVIASQFGDDAPIVVEYEPRPSLRGIDGPDAPPLRGGQKILTPSERPGYLDVCTSAFVAYQATRTDAALFVNDYYLLSAGHCEEAGGQGIGTTGAVWSPDKFVIGTSRRNAFRNGSKADAMAIAMQGHFKSNQVAIDPGVYRRIRCMMTTDIKAGAKQGQIEIISGARTGGYRTGKLLRTNATITYTDEGTGRSVTLTRMHMADYFGQKGDSGGSIHGTRECHYRAHGIESGGTEVGVTPIRSYYTPIVSATMALGLSGVWLTD